MPPLNKITQIKRIYAKINTNLIRLEQFVANPHKYDDDDVANNVQQLQMETTKLLQRLKQIPTGRIARVIKKRQKRRKKLRIQRKMEKQKTRKSKDQQKDEISFPLNQANIDEETKPTKLYNHHNQLKKRADAERFVQTFELLEELHLARSWDAQATQQFASKISTLRRIWLNELRSAITEQAQHKSHETQWNKVFFGITTTDYHPDKQKLKDFLRIRNTWDSYISQSKHASAIPSGWVLPPLEAMPSWQQYQIE